MKKIVIILLFISLLAAAYLAQRRKAAPTKTAAPKAAAVPKADALQGVIEGRTYTNRSLGFSITLPESWLIPSGDFEAEMKTQGYDLSLRAPNELDPASKAKLNQALKHVTVLLTAYRSSPDSADNAILRVSEEDLTSQPQIKDAVDYFDAIRQSYKMIKLPPDFKYSDTQAERLGSKAFAFLDTSSKAGKKRIYATVRDRKAILFTLSYTNDEDLQTLRQMLTEGDFALK
jgi:hypothetical protein